MDFEETVIGVSPKYHGAIIDVENQTVQLPNGETAHRDVVHHAAAVAMLALTETGKGLFEEQWRAPIEQVTIEIPAGKLDDRDRDNPEAAAIRELNEETRYAAGAIAQVSQFYTSVGFSDEFMTLYLATKLTPVTTALPQDADENITLHEYTLSEAKQLLTDGKIVDQKTVTAIYYWQLLDAGLVTPGQSLI
ncbi:NUDIX hydrolase [Furfurilactobacillus curtus]|uniref:ADP-ribose pyrophosphatase n=1 Tax=Furfurilactobacillus curtus TaxID=1746200 RepID=A0ABQ5JM01_9LACO